MRTASVFSATFALVLLAATSLAAPTTTLAQTDPTTTAAIDAALSAPHRSDRVIALAKAAGFELVARSDINRNPKDTHDYKNGVWTLPPDLSVPQGEDRQKYLDIGESDRLTLKFRKPTGK